MTVPSNRQETIHPQSMTTRRQGVRAAGASNSLHRVVFRTVD